MDNKLNEIYDEITKYKNKHDLLLKEQNYTKEIINKEKEKDQYNIPIDMYDDLYNEKMDFYYKNLLFLEENIYKSIIEYISITYDMNDIDYILNTINFNKIPFIDYINQNISLLKDNLILKKLFNNYIKNKEYINLNIVGPNYYKHYNYNNFTINSINYGNINVYLYGESHFQEIKDEYLFLPYIFFYNYLDIILQNSSSFNDIYVEDRKGSVNAKLISEYYSDFELKTIENLNNTFRECDTILNNGKWELSKIDRCNLFRYHYVDIRVLNKDILSDDSSSDKNPLLSEDVTLYNIFNLIYKYIIDENIKDINIDYYSKLTTTLYYKLDNLIKTGFNINYEKNEIEIKNEFYDFFINDIFSDSTLKKELTKSFLGSDIKLFIENQLKLTIKDYIDKESSSHDTDSKFITNLYSLYNNIKDKEYDLNKDNIFTSLYFSKIIPIYSHKMDCYTLSRIFKAFNIKPEEKQPIYPKNIYIYSGSAHSQTYSKFFEQVLNFNLSEMAGIALNENIMDYTEGGQSPNSNYINLNVYLPNDVIENFKKQYDDTMYFEDTSLVQDENLSQSMYLP